jgi:hypothetical protein
MISALFAVVLGAALVQNRYDDYKFKRRGPSPKDPDAWPWDSKMGSYDDLRRQILTRHGYPVEAWVTSYYQRAFPRGYMGDKIDAPTRAMLLWLASRVALGELPMRVWSSYEFDAVQEKILHDTFRLIHWRETTRRPFKDRTWLQMLQVETEWSSHNLPAWTNEQGQCLPAGELVERYTDYDDSSHVGHEQIDTGAWTLQTLADDHMVDALSAIEQPSTRCHLMDEAWTLRDGVGRPWAVWALQRETWSDRRTLYAWFLSPKGSSCEAKDLSDDSSWAKFLVRVSRRLDHDVKHWSPEIRTLLVVHSNYVHDLLKPPENFDELEGSFDALINNDVMISIIQEVEYEGDSGLFMLWAQRMQKDPNLFSKHPSFVLECMFPTQDKCAGQSIERVGYDYYGSSNIFQILFEEEWLTSSEVSDRAILLVVRVQIFIQMLSEDNDSCWHADVRVGAKISPDALQSLPYGHLLDIVDARFEPNLEEMMDGQTTFWWPVANNIDHDGCMTGRFLSKDERKKQLSEIDSCDTLDEVIAAVESWIVRRRYLEKAWDQLDDENVPGLKLAQDLVGDADAIRSEALDKLRRLYEDYNRRQDLPPGTLTERDLWAVEDKTDENVPEDMFGEPLKITSETY